MTGSVSSISFSSTGADFNKKIDTPKDNDDAGFTFVVRTAFQNHEKYFSCKVVYYCVIRLKCVKHEVLLQPNLQ